MPLQERLVNDLKEAILNRDTLKKTVIRYLRSAIHDAEIDRKAVLDDEAIISILTKQAKQRRDSIEAFKSGNRLDLVEIEEAELTIIMEYLPQQMSETEIESLARKAEDESGAKTTKEIGKVSILKILLPDRQINKNIYLSFDTMFNNLHLDNWIISYIHWELFLIKELGFDVNLNIKKNIKLNNNSIEINDKIFNIPKILLNSINNANKTQIREALEFNRSLIMENFIIPNQLRFPLSRNLLEKYYN